MPGLSRRAALATLMALAAIQAALFFYYVRVNLVLQPYWDMYSHVTRYLQFRGDGRWWAYLWDPHVQHRHLWMRLLTALDIEALGGTGYPFVIAAVACLLITAWLAWREIVRGAPSDASVAVGCLAVMLVLTSVAAVDSATPINAIYPQVVVFSVLALVLFTAPDSGGPESTQPPWRRTAGIAAAIAAVFANTVALALWPILAWIAWQERSRRWLTTVVVSGVVFSTVYAMGLPMADSTRPASGDLLARADYLVAYVGLPWTRAAALAIPGRIAGILLLVVAGWALLRHALRQGLARRQRIAIGLILFSLASASLAAIGRAGIQEDVVVPVRYTVLLAPLHIGLLMLLLPQVAPFDSRVKIAAVGVAGLLLLQQVAVGEAARTQTRTLRATLQRFAAGEEDAGMKTVVFDNLDQARQQLNAIQSAGLYLNAR